MTTSLALLMVLSGLLHVTWNTAAKRVGGHIGVLWLAQGVGALASLPFALDAGFPPLADGRAYLHIGVTGALEALYIVTLSRAYALGDLSLVYPVARGLGVAFAAAFGLFALGEKMTPLGVTGIALVAGGGFLIGASSGGRSDRRALLCAALIGVNLSVGTLNDKLAVARVHPVTYIFCMFFLATLFTAPLALTRWRASVAEGLERHRRSIAVVGLGSLVGYALVLWAFRFGPLAYIVAFRELSVAVGAGVGLVWLRETLRKRKVAGVVAIVCGLVLIKLT
jgi:drug/metabolite transporter (DMT)-like permease